MSLEIAVKDTSFDQCIKCTICTVYCPVAAVNPDFPGPKQAGPDGERLREKSSEYYDDMLKYCTNCKRCETACPSGVKIGDIIAVARGEFGKKEWNPKLVRNFILSHTDVFGSLATPLAPIINKVTQIPMMKSLMQATIGVHKKKSLPKYSHGTFRQWFKKHAPDQSGYIRSVNYFHGCYVNYNYPQQGKDLVRVMNAMGIGVHLLEKERCCGIPKIANDFHNGAQKNAKFNVKQFEKAVKGNGMPIIASSSTCSLTIKDEYPHVLGVDNSAVADDISFISRFLFKEFMSGNAPKMNPINKSIVYHTPCHLERSGEAVFTIELLKMIPGLKVTVLDSECCGLAGTYGFKEENYDNSIKIGSGLFEQINHSDADFAMTDCEACKWQIEENTKLDSVHPIALLAQALA